jgi:Amt family ammonium transporter
MFLNGIGPTDMFGNAGFPKLVFVAYQMNGEFMESEE